jgi:hypothetical protein
MDATRVPEALRPLVPLVEKWGAVSSDFERYALAERAQADPKNMEELRTLAKQFTPELQKIAGEWMDREPITESHETAKFYFTGLLLDELDLLASDRDWNTVENQIANLGKFGSYRLASGRMWAARYLADFGAQAKAALSALSKALSDEDARVRVWAHYALAILEGDEEAHAAAIRSILAQHGEKDGEGDYIDEVGMEAEAALEELYRRLKSPTV